MGLFGGSRRTSSSTTNTTNNVDNSNVVFDDIDGSAANVDGSFNRVNIIETDNEAIESSFEFAEGITDSALLFAGIAQDDANDLVEGAIKDSSSATKSAIDNVSGLLVSQQKGSVEDIRNIIFALIAAVVIILIAVAFMSGRS